MSVSSQSFHPDFLTPGGLADTGRDCSSQGQRIPRDCKQLAQERTFHMKTNQSEGHTLILSFTGLSHTDHYSLALITPGPVPDNQGQPLPSRARWNYSNQPILSLLTLPCFALPSKTTIKALVHIFSLLLLPLDQLWCFPCSPVCHAVPLPLGNCE